MNIFNSFGNHIFSVFKENMLYRSNTQLNVIDKRIVCIAAIALVVFISAYYLLNETYKATKLVLALDKLSAMMKVGVEKIQNIRAKLFPHSSKEEPDSESLEAPSVSQSLEEEVLFESLEAPSVSQSCPETSYSIEQSSLFQSFMKEEKQKKDLDKKDSSKNLETEGDNDIADKGGLEHLKNVAIPNVIDLEEEKQKEDLYKKCGSSSEIVNYCKMNGEKLKHLNLGHANLNADQIEEICKFCPKLKTFEWHFSGIKDKCLKKLTVLESLESLDLSGNSDGEMEGCNDITDDGFKHFAAFKKLKFLNLSGFDQISDEALKHLKVLVNLESLNLSHCNNNITDDGIQYLTALINLKSLNLEGLDEITNKALEHLKVLVKLESLNLTDCEEIDDDGIKHLTALINLRSLNLRGLNKITNKALEHLKVLVKLNFLNLNHCNKITDDGMNDLTTLDSLETLKLEWCTQLTDKTLKLLSALKNLKLLDLRLCKKITKKECENFKSSVKIILS